LYAYPRGIELQTAADQSFSRSKFFVFNTETGIVFNLPEDLKAQWNRVREGSYQIVIQRLIWTIGLTLSIRFLGTICR
jgi:hypothetical protein